MKEEDFINQIDTNFPYFNEKEWNEVIKKGNQISDNASFMVLHEICRAPKNVSKKDKLRMLFIWNKESRHPLKNDIIKCAKDLIEGNSFSTEEASLLLNKIEPYQGLYNALNIVYFACNDKSGNIDIIYNNIMKKWSNKI